MFVKVNGELRYLWRAGDLEGEVLEAYVSKTRDRKAALTFLRKAMRRHSRPTRADGPLPLLRRCPARSRGK